MNKTLKEKIRRQRTFFDLLFRPGDEVCFSENEYGTKVIPYSCFDVIPQTFQFFSINALKDSRKDANVTSFRNILLEFDGIGPLEQINIIMEIPHSTCVWSGGKSYHCIISLEYPLPNKEAYDRLVKRIYDRVPQADKQAKNPSRFSRIAENVRDTGHVQALRHVMLPVTMERLERWLGPETVEDAYPEPKPTKGLKGILKGSTQYFLAFGAELGEWNRSLFLSAIDMARAGYDEDHIWSSLHNVTGRLDASDKRTINSALKIARTE